MLGNNKGVVYQISAEVSKFLQGVDKVQYKLQGLESKTQNIQQSLQAVSSVADPLFGILTKGVVAVSGAMTTATGAVLYFGGSFESQMTRAATISGATSEELQKMTDRARELGRELPISATNAAEAFTVMAQRGWSVEESMAAVGDVVNLSISQMYGLAESADIIGATLTNFNLGVDQASRVVDVFNNACNQSAASMEKLHYAMKYISPVAASLGMTLEETTAMVEALLDAGFGAEQAGSLGSMVLSKLSEEATRGGLAFKHLGVDILDASGQMRPAKEIMADLSKSAFSLADAQAVFGARTAKGALALVKAGAKLEDYEKGLKKFGSTQEAVSRQMETWVNKFQTVLSAAEDLSHTGFAQIKGAAGEVADSIVSLINTFNKWLQETELIKKAIQAFAEGLGLSVVPAKELKKTLEAINVDGLVSQFKAFGKAVNAIAVAFGKLVKAVPWNTLITNLEGIAKVIVGLWIGSKIAGIILGITTFVAHLSLITLGAGAAGGALAALGSMVLPFTAWALAIGYVVAALGQLAKAFAEVRKGAQVFSETAKSTREDLLALGDEEVVSRIETLQKRIEDMRGSMGGPNGSGKENPQLQKWQEQLERLQDVHVELDLSVPKDVEEYANKILDEEIVRLREKKGLLHDQYWIKYRLLALEKSTEEQLKLDSLGSERYLVENVVSQAETMYKELAEKARRTAEEFGIPMEKMGDLLGKQLGDQIKVVMDNAAQSAQNPFLVEAISGALVEAFQTGGFAADEMGQAATKALGDVVAGSNKAKDAISGLRDEISGISDPMKDVAKAYKEGFIQGPQMKEAMRFLQENAQKLMELSKQEIQKMYEGILPDDIISGIAAMKGHERIIGTGLTPQGQNSLNRAASQFGDFVQNQNTRNDINVNIQNVNVRNPEDARRTGEELGNGILRSQKPYEGPRNYGPKQMGLTY